MGSGATAAPPFRRSDLSSRRHPFGSVRQRVRSARHHRRRRSEPSLDPSAEATRAETCANVIQITKIGVRTERDHALLRLAGEPDERLSRSDGHHNCLPEPVL
jgi:hypothetical protein